MLMLSSCNTRDKSSVLANVASMRLSCLGSSMTRQTICELRRRRTVRSLVSCARATAPKKSRVIVMNRFENMAKGGSVRDSTEGSRTWWLSRYVWGEWLLWGPHASRKRLHFKELITMFVVEQKMDESRKKMVHGGNFPPWCLRRNWFVRLQWNIIRVRAWELT